MKLKIGAWLCFCFFQLHAQVAVFKQYGMNQGLNSTKIRAITEDQRGVIWIGTDAALFSFDGQSFTQHDSSPIATELNIQDLQVLDHNVVLVGTRNNGLLIHKNNSLSQLSTAESDIQTINAITQGPESNSWLATNKGLFQLSKNHRIEPTGHQDINAFSGKKINTVKKIDDQHIAFSQHNVLYIYDFIHQSMAPIQFAEGVSIHDVHKDTRQVLWIGTSDQLFRYDLTAKKFLPVPELQQASRILSIKPHQENVWIASIDGGLYRVNIHTLESQQFTHRKRSTFSLSDNNIMALYISRDGTLWAGGFYHGLNSINLKLMGFQFETNETHSIHCAKNPRIFSIQTDQQGSLWLGNSDGLIHWNPTSQYCQLIDHQTSGQLPPFAVYGTSIDVQRVWIASSIGLLSYERQSQQIIKHPLDATQTASFFVHQLNNKDLLVGTSRGLYRYDPRHTTFHQITVPDQRFAQISYSQYFADHQGQVLLPTSQGLLLFNPAQQLQVFKGYNNFFNHKNIAAVAANEQGELFISVKDFGLYHLDANHRLVQHYFAAIKHNNIRQILLHEDMLWMSSDHNIIALDIATEKKQFYASEANENYLAASQSSFMDKTGQFYFGGNQGLIRFYPEHIETDFHVYPLTFDQLYVMNKPVTPNHNTETGFNLTQPLNQTNKLVFSHQDKVIGFGFVQPNYHTPNGIEYQYKLSPVTSEWTPLPGQDRRLTFTHLKSGHYQLDIQATDNNSSRQKSIEFTVKNPPWLSWQAFCFYALMSAAMVFFYIRRKVANEKRINAYLQKQVKRQTSHIAQQKQVVEDLMARKNEIFSNVSHEFRTPITLILGPMEALKKTEKDPSRKQNFSLVIRNAKRLLELVNQMLKLAQINETETMQKQLIELSSRLNMIIEPQIYLAKLKQIKVIIEPLDKVKLLLTEDALETIMANFLSNAIKYTDPGGTIRVGTRLSTAHVAVFVKDTGPGIGLPDQQRIFKRFERLHQNAAAGTGIGLALVKELAVLNQAELILNSAFGQGSEFIIKFPLDASLQAQDSKHTPSVLGETTHIEPSILTNKQTVLVIDDNEDMLLYLKQVLADHFNCILATSGTDGIAKALKNVPDIVVSDVMMPGVDGFEVCRQLRNETITSHIPLVLLTAVNEKASRIKGWRESIDRYLSKPFDAQELILQLKNILNTRQLLIAQYLENAASAKQPYFSEMDQAFINKLNLIISEGYADPLFNLEKMAGLMAVSDRQLQRKIKALLDRSPMDLVRAHRLKQAAQLLVKGKPINYIADVCGFTHASHFSYSFKKNYGITPKAYQKLKPKA